MSQETQVTNDLQFERAEFQNDEQKSACSLCSGALGDRYFQVNGQTACAGCCERLKAAATGSPLKRGMVSVMAGAAAAVAGSILYYAILAMTGYEFGLIAVVIGFMVGKAVSWGSDARGGWLYQTMAIALTYLAIVSAYVPVIIAELSKPDRAEQAVAADAAPVAVAATVDAQPVAVQPVAAQVVDEAPAKRATLGRALLALVLLFAFMCATPFLAGVSNIMGLVIIAIGLYEAWKLNRRRELVISGPHMIAAAAANP